MTKSTQQSGDGQSDKDQEDCRASRTVHPEDLAIGDSVAVAEVSCQLPTYLWCGSDFSLTRVHKVNVPFIPAGEFELYKVISVCLPFVLCEQTSGKHSVLDLRLVRLFRLNEAFAKRCQHHLVADTGKKRKKKSKKKPRKKR
jgi:hypothetical protein